MKRFVLSFAFIIGLLTSASTLQAQTVNMNSYITLTVKKNKKISFEYAAAADSTPIKIKNNNIGAVRYANKNKGSFFNTSLDTTITIYGDITKFYCKNNGANIIGIDISHNIGLLELNCANDSIRNLDVTKNTSLELLDCNSNQLSSLDVTKNTELTKLFCGSNKLSSLDVTKNTKLTKLKCFLNNLSTLDVTNNTQLTELNCHSNRLTTLYIKNDTLLKELDCHDNLLTSLDVSSNFALNKLYCYSNAFTTSSLDTLYCLLPYRFPFEKGKIYLLVDSLDSNKSTIVATNKQNAIVKNWKVQYLSTNTDIPATTGKYMCSNGGGNRVNMKKYVRLILNERKIGLSLKADSVNTQVKIVDGNRDTTFNITNSLYGTFIEYAARSSEIKIYGNITEFDCSFNFNSIFLVDASNNSGLTKILAHHNYFSTRAINKLYCLLPDRKGKEQGELIIANDQSEYNYYSIIASNAQNAKNKNWRVIFRNGVDIITKGDYECSGSGLNMEKYITLTARRGDSIELRLMAYEENIPVRIVSGSSDTTFMVGDLSPLVINYKCAANTITVYGDITEFSCGQKDSIANITSLDVSKNTSLTLLNCFSNRLTELDVSKNKKLEILYCYRNRLTELDVSENKKLETLYCSENQLRALYIANNNSLRELCCPFNLLTSLDVSNCTHLERLECYNNRLSSIDISNCSQLYVLGCFSNRLSTNALDDIFCALPNRSTKGLGSIIPIIDTTSTYIDTLSLTNAKNAIDKNWKVRCVLGNVNKPTTTGTYVCGAPHNINMDSYITLDVKRGAEIKLNFKAAIANTRVKIESGSSMHDIIVGTDWYDGNTPSSFTVTSQDTTIKVYGDITGFDCSGNGDNITNIYVVKNTLLKTLNCSKNSLSTLNLVLNTQLADLNCSSNQIASLDISNNRALIDLDCSSNGLTTLSLAENTSLRTLNCSNNSLQSLDVSNNKRLKNIYCYGNNFTSIALDEIYCDLPDREPVDSARIFTLNELSSASEVAVVEATNSANTTNKNWKLKTYNTNGIHTDINTIGDFQCPVEYNLYISGMRITSANCNNIPCVSGTVKYDPSTKTLTLDNATINAGKDYYQAIRSEIDGLILNVVGTNNLISTNTGIGFGKSMTITGGGTLNVTTLITTTPSVCAIYGAGGDLIIDSCTVNAKGRWGITGHLATDNLTIKNATVTAEGMQYGSITDFGNMTLIGCSITQPAEAAFDTVLHCVALNGEKVKSKVVITKNVTAIDLPIAESALTLYPNPVSDVLYLSATARTIRVYNVYGVEVAHATDTDRVEVSHLPAGVYTVKADGNIAKMIKR